MKSNNSSFQHRFDGGFTVLMAVYHKEEPSRFQRALTSVFSNTIQPDFVILVVDGPIPLSLEKIISDIQRCYDNFHVIRLSENRGLAAALNEGLAHVKTAWIVRADSDDINRPYRFEKQAAAIASSNIPIDVIGGVIQEIDFDDTLLAVRRTVESNYEIRHFIRRRTPFNHMTVAYRTELVRSVGGYPEIFLKEDYALWASMIYAGAYCVNLPDILVDAVTGKEMYKRRGGFKYALAEINLQRHLVKCQIKPVFHALVDGAIRSFIFLLPQDIRAYFYRTFLRAL